MASVSLVGVFPVGLDGVYLLFSMSVPFFLDFCHTEIKLYVIFASEKKIERNYGDKYFTWRS